MTTTKPIRVLGIETSCDETAAAVVENGRTVLSSVVASQAEVHRRFGGVVPEVASRRHVEHITRVLEAALEDAGVRPNDLTAIAVTHGPGLVGALLVGVAAAKALAFSWGLPLVPVHHIAGHIYACRLVGEMRFPLVALVVSGGHTELLYLRDEGHVVVVGQTRDDAAGEAYDKVARVLGLPYPGGPELDRLAAEGRDVYAFPRAFLEPDSLDFSFSGLKTAVLNAVHGARQRGEPINLADVAASFQAAVVDVLVEKAFRAVKRYDARQLVVAGGVAANRGLRAALAERAAREGVEVLIPPLSLCTDNAAMIAAAGTVLYRLGRVADLDLNAVPDLDLTAE
ncbi:tRNA (adenosine(37)-N6)-threonylcarbamoyltransferase complex transferase subunit TsaD [Calditerricola yamamurae]